MVMIPFFNCFSQLRSLLSLRDFVDEMQTDPEHGKKIPKFSIREWNSLEKIVEALEPAYIVTLKMQRVKYPPSEFFADWMSLSLQMEALKDDNSLAECLLEEMKTRETGIIQTPIILSSVFIDPRYRMLLCEEQNTIAINHLMKLKRRIDRGCVTTAHSNNNEKNGAHNILSDLIASKMKDNPFYRHNMDESEFIRTILAIPVLTDCNACVFEYWASRKEAFPDIFKLHCVVNAAAPTQTSVERAFSSFSYILSPLRNKLSDESINRILILRLNSNMRRQ